MVPDGTALVQQDHPEPPVTGFPPVSIGQPVTDNRKRQPVSAL